MPQVPEYIVVTDAAGVAVAYLAPEPDGVTCEIEQELNGQCNLILKLPTSSAKAAELLPERRIAAGGRVFAIMSPASEQRSRDGRKTWLQVTAPEIWSLLAKTYVTVANDHEPGPDWSTVSILASDLGQGGFPSGSAGSALYRLLQGTGWTVGTVDTTGSLVEQHDLESEMLSLLENIQKVQQTWGGYLVWDSVNKTVSLREESAWRPGTGVRIEYAKNLKGLNREVNSDLVTRLYAFGQDNLTIAGVNNGQLYLDDNHYTDAVYEGIWTNQDIDDPAELKAAAQRVLAEISEVRANYQVDLIDLSVLPEDTHEAFSLGDIVRVVDPEIVQRLITLADIQAAYGTKPGMVGWDPDCDLNGDGRVSSSELTRIAQAPKNQIWVRSTRGVDLRVIKHRYDVFEPWKCSIEVGKPIKSLYSMIASTVKAASFVEKALKPNPGAGNLLKGFVNSFTTMIKSANGKLVWSDDALTAIEIDGSGNPTGKRVQITPGGVGISSNGGQTYDVAMTGAGILANRIIVSDLYALASDDGYTQVKGDGLHVFDQAQQERVHVGRWLIEGAEHYGLRVFSAAGTVMLDDQGIMQTWEKPGGGELDASYPVQMEIYLPPETLSIKRALLRFRLKKFRSTSKAAASGGGTTSGPSSLTTTDTAPSTTSGASSETTTDTAPATTSGPSSRYTTANGGGATSGGGVWFTQAGYSSGMDATHLGGSHTHSISTVAGHNHGNQVPSDGGHGHTAASDGSHSHVITLNHSHTVPDHTHQMDHTHEVPAHSHGMAHTHTVPAHNHGMNHTHQVPAHSHGLEFGIYEGPMATNITVKINSIDLTGALGGPFNTDQASLNIAPYLVTGIWNVIEFAGASLGRIDATVFIQAKMGV